MNHEQRGNLVRKIISQVRDREYPYKTREKRKINWHDYDLAQCREIGDVINLIRELVNSAVKRLEPESAKGPGRPPVQPSDIAKVLLLQSYLGVSNRVAEGLIYLFDAKLGLSQQFSYKTIERGYDRESVDRILDMIFQLTNEPVQGLEKIFSVDGSGSPTSVKQNYAHDRQRQRGGKNAEENDLLASSTSDPKHDYVYKVAAIGTEYKLFSGWISTTDHSLGETTLFPEVRTQTIENHSGAEMMLGDGVFGNRPICKLVSSYGLTLRALPHRNCTLKSKGVREWINMLWALSEDSDAWLAEYHMRSISETGYSVLKRANPQPLRKRLNPRRETEDYLRGICHNMAVLSNLPGP